jgi:hypothetical protein
MSYLSDLPTNRDLRTQVVESHYQRYYMNNEREAFVLVREKSMRSVTYERYEHTSAVAGDENEVLTGALLNFVYDIPYFAPCGMFPPLHIANQIFSMGSAGGGMSPGTEWEPFTVTKDEYDELVEAVKHTPVSELKSFARYAFLPMKFDHSLDDISEWSKWFGAICKKHREEWRAEIARVMNPHKRYGVLFTTIDTYVRARHHCFVAELDFAPTEWTVCMRPTEENTRPHDRYACKYFRLSLEEAAELCAVNGLGSSLWERIDQELRSIGDLAPD